MPIKFQCSACGSKLSVKDDLSGKRGQCPSCNNALVVPRATQTQPATWRQNLIRLFKRMLPADKANGWLYWEDLSDEDKKVLLAKFTLKPETILGVALNTSQKRDYQVVITDTMVVGSVGKQSVDIASITGAYMSNNGFLPALALLTEGSNDIELPLLGNNTMGARLADFLNACAMAKSQAELTAESSEEGPWSETLLNSYSQYVTQVKESMQSVHSRLGGTPSSSTTRNILKEWRQKCDSLIPDKGLFSKGLSHSNQQVLEAWETSLLIIRELVDADLALNEWHTPGLSHWLFRMGLLKDVSDALSLDHAAVRGLGVTIKFEGVEQTEHFSRNEATAGILAGLSVGGEFVRQNDLGQHHLSQDIVIVVKSWSARITNLATGDISLDVRADVKYSTSQQVAGSALDVKEWAYSNGGFISTSGITPKAMGLINPRVSLREQGRVVGEQLRVDIPAIKGAVVEARWRGQRIICPNCGAASELLRHSTLVQYCEHDERRLRAMDEIKTCLGCGRDVVTGVELSLLESGRAAAARKETASSLMGLPWIIVVVVWIWHYFSQVSQYWRWGAVGMAAVVTLATLPWYLKASARVLEEKGRQAEAMAGVRFADQVGENKKKLGIS